VLAVSLALNLFFIAGAAWTRLNPPAASGFDRRFRQMAAELALDPQQQAAFVRYEAAMRADRETMRRRIRPLFDAVRQEIGKPQPNVAHIGQLLDQVAETHRALQHQAVSNTLVFVATLSTAQRARFVALERERWEQHSHRR
jgi:Spy/CpxP family protein refolding chaperone